MKILCYGDSNTWGQSPNMADLRYSKSERWTGILQSKLGPEFEIIEEGLCGRTTVFDDPKEAGRNGKTSLIDVLKRQKNFNIVILMLGTNDFKERFNATAEHIATNVEELIILIEHTGAKIIMMSPPLVIENCQIPMSGMKGAEEKSKHLGAFLKIVADKHGCEFIELANFIQSSPIDGAHLEKDAHGVIADLLANNVVDMT